VTESEVAFLKDSWHHISIGTKRVALIVGALSEPAAQIPGDVVLGLAVAARNLCACISGPIPRMMKRKRLGPMGIAPASATAAINIGVPTTLIQDCPKQHSSRSQANSNSGMSGV
jgi:hypothetical protein